jgi:hypothetical protein
MKTNEQLAHKNSACEQSTRRKSNGAQYGMRYSGWRDAFERLAGRYPMKGARESLTKPVNPETAPTKVGELR